jgi:hypothetical protein
MNTLHSITGITARIFELSGREPFMLAADLAEIYGTSVKRLGEAVSRNPERFPEDFCFFLTEAEEEQMWSHIATTSAKKRDDFRVRVFTHAGAYALSAVLKTPIAAEVSVIIHRAFAAMEKRALDETRFILMKLQSEVSRRKPIRVLVMDSARQGLSFQAMWELASYSRPQLAKAVRECFALGLIEQMPAGTPVMQLDLFAGA